MKIGVALPHSGPLAHPEAIRQVAAEAEALGYDSVWVHDHITYDIDWLAHRTSGIAKPGDALDPNFYEALTTLAYVAGATRRVYLGTAIVVAPLRDPRILARQVMTLQALSGGRLQLGLGQGDYPADFRVMSIPYGERAERLEECLAALASLLHGGYVSFAGKSISFESAAFFPQVPHVPILLGGGIRRRAGSRAHELVEPTLRRIARWGHGWIPEGPPHVIAEGRQRIRQLADAYGRSEVQFEISAATPLYIGWDELAAQKVSRGLDYELVGSLPTIAKRIDAYRAAKIERLLVRCWAEDLPLLLSMLRALAEQELK